LEEFGASGLAWGRIVEEIIVEELWKHLVNAAPVLVGPLETRNPKRASCSLIPVVLLASVLLKGLKISRKKDI
jgi:hypothetical protein